MDVILIGGAFIFAAWRLWVAIGRALDGPGRSYPQRERAAGELVQPVQGDHSPCYHPGEWEREQADRGIGRDAAAELASRLAILSEGEAAPSTDWGRASRLAAEASGEPSSKIRRDLEERFNDLVILERGHP